MNDLDVFSRDTIISDLKDELASVKNSRDLFQAVNEELSETNLLLKRALRASDLGYDDSEDSRSYLNNSSDFSRAALLSRLKKIPKKRTGFHKSTAIAIIFIVLYLIILWFIPNGTRSELDEKYYSGYNEGYKDGESVSFDHGYDAGYKDAVSTQ